MRQIEDLTHAMQRWVALSFCINAHFVLVNSRLAMLSFGMCDLTQYVRESQVKQLVAEGWNRFVTH